MAEGEKRQPTAVEEIVEAAQRRPEKGRRPVGQAFGTRVRRAFVENAGLKFVALVLAVTVFVLVHSDEDVYLGVNVGVSYTLPQDRVLVSEPPESVRVTVRGSRRKIRRFDEGALGRIHIDLRTHRRSEYVFQQDHLQLAEGVELVRFAPPSFLTKFEKRLEKEVPVEVQPLGDVPPGYRMTDVRAAPATVRISGPASAIDSTSVVRTREVSLIGRSASFREPVLLLPPEDLVQIIEPAEGKAEVEVTIAEERASRRLGPVRVSLAGRRGVGSEELARWKVAPEEVDVILHGSRLAVDGIDPGEIQAIAEISSEEVAAGEARVLVQRLGEGIGVEVVPDTVKILPRGAPRAPNDAIE